MFVIEKRATKIWSYQSDDGFMCVKGEREVHYSVDELVEAIGSF